jgi:hypothetical protein
MRLSVSIKVLVVLVLFAAPSAAAAQHATPLVSAGMGGTFYCIVTRCNTGTTVFGSAGVDFASFLHVEATVRRHLCFDCDRFLVAEAGLHAQYAGPVFTPYAGGGFGTSSDPDFMGTVTGFHAEVGTWVWPWQNWGVRIELRAREVGSGNHMGELSASGARRFTR